MPTKICKNGHSFEKSSSCPVCPICSSEEMNQKYSAEFPQIGAPAFRALDKAGISKLLDLTKYTEVQLLAFHGFGPKVLKQLRQRLHDEGLSFKK